MIDFFSRLLGSLFGAPAEAAPAPPPDRQATPAEAEQPAQVEQPAEEEMPECRHCGRAHGEHDHDRLVRMIGPQVATNGQGQFWCADGRHTFVLTKEPTADYARLAVYLRDTSRPQDVNGLKADYVFVIAGERQKPLTKMPSAEVCIALITFFLGRRRNRYAELQKMKPADRVVDIDLCEAADVKDVTDSVFGMQRMGYA